MSADEGAIENGGVGVVIEDSLERIFLPQCFDGWNERLFVEVKEQALERDITPQASGFFKFGGCGAVKDNFPDVVHSAVLQYSCG